MTSGALNQVVLTQTPGITADTERARPKSINLTLSGCCCQFTTITMSGLRSAHTIPKVGQSCGQLMYNWLHFCHGETLVVSIFYVNVQCVQALIKEFKVKADMILVLKNLGVICIEGERREIQQEISFVWQNIRVNSATYNIHIFKKHWQGFQALSHCQHHYWFLIQDLPFSTFIVTMNVSLRIM